MIRIFDSLEALAVAAAERVRSECAEAIRARGGFRLALSGGTSPLPLYRALAAPSQRDAIDWTRVEVLFADERAVPPDDVESNFRGVREALLDPLGFDPARVRRMEADAPDLEAAARSYERWLTTPLDLVILGVGADGHTASLFPYHPALLEAVRRVVAVLDSPKPPPRRLTITPRTLREARVQMVIATGDDKANAVTAALERRGTAGQVPARLLRDGDWYLDQAAGRGLRGLEPSDRQQ